MNFKEPDRPAGKFADFNLKRNTTKLDLGTRQSRFDPCIPTTASEHDLVRDIVVSTSEWATDSAGASDD